MTNHVATTWIAFANSRCIAQGPPGTVATEAKAYAGAHPRTTLLIFDAHSSQPIELDLRQSISKLRDALPPATESRPSDESAVSDAPRGPGRPRLGVVAREVTLLPRHWDWLATQRGGASVALRTLVEHAMKASIEIDRKRAARESAYRFMHAIAGDAPGFEAAARALFADDSLALRKATAAWPADIREHALALSGQGS